MILVCNIAFIRFNDSTPKACASPSWYIRRLEDE